MAGQTPAWWCCPMAPSAQAVAATMGTPRLPRGPREAVATLEMVTGKRHLAGWEPAQRGSGLWRLGLREGRGPNVGDPGVWGSA